MRGWLLVVGLAGCRGFFDTPPVTPDGPPRSDAQPDAPAAPLAYVQSAASSVVASNSLTVGFPLVQLTGDTNLIVIGWSSGSLVSINDANGNTYTAATGPTTAGDGWTQQIYIATNIKAGANTVNISLSAQTYAHLGVFDYMGVAGVDGSVSAIGTASSTPATTPLSTTNAHDLLFAALTAQNSINTTVIQQFNSRLSGLEYLMADAEVTAVGAYPATTSATPQADWVMQLLALRAE